MMVSRCVYWLDSKFVYDMCADLRMLDAFFKKRNCKHDARGDMTSPPDLNFSLHDTLHATHGLHAFAAKCAPPLAAWGIKEYSNVGEYVVDPMAGSGTTLVEGRLAGRHVRGVDLDPVASLLCRVKATPLPAHMLQDACTGLLTVVQTACAEWDCLQSQGMSVERINSTLHVTLPSFHNRDYWFLPEVSAKLAIIKRSIDQAQVTECARDFFYVAFSSLIVARTSVANARDLVHSRHHYMAHPRTPDVANLFKQRLERMQRQMTAFVDGLPADYADHTTDVHRADARKLPIATESADLVFTSPPYCNALDYPRAHQLVVAWLGDVLGVDSQAYTALARTYIGTERARKALPLDLDNIAIDSATACRVIRDVAAADRVGAAIVQRYFKDMTVTLAEIGRVLKPDRHAILVICPSNIRRVSIPSHEVFVEIGEKLRLEGGYQLCTVAHYERVLDDRKRLLPYMDDTALAQRMRTEYVIVLQKRSVRAHAKQQPVAVGDHGRML